MGQAFSGLSALIFIGFIGYVLARQGILTREADRMLQQVAFYVASPALMLAIIADSDLSVLLSLGTAVFLAAAATTTIIFTIGAVLILKVDRTEGVMVGATTGWVNANNIGVPVAVYILADVDYIAAIVVLQLVAFAPLVVAALHLASGGNNLGSILGRTLATPLIGATALGVVISLTGWQIPQLVFVPVEILSGAAIPIMLLALGAGLHGMRVFRFEPGTSRIIVSSVLAKGVLMPTVAWILAAFVFRLDQNSVFVLTALSALPAAQNTYNLAVTFKVAESTVREILVYSTIVFFPVLLFLVLVFT